MLANWVAFKGQAQPLGLMDRVLDDIDYHSYIDDGTEEGQDRWENVLELRRLASEFQDQTLEAFLEQVALVSDQDTLDTTSNAPTLLTLHAAKGLEFPVVFIVGLNDGILPHSRSFDDPEAMMEERRLFYVGITRAKDRLYLVQSQNRSAYGYAEPMEPSRFLWDIPAELVNNLQVKMTQRRGQGWTEQSSQRWGSNRTSAANGATQAKQYQPGMRVKHPSWGEGMVLNSRLQDDDEIIDIFFEDMGLKRVVASLARLETME
jgi:DNA helicase-2/ATP-dependent DNA helicase PcrA